MTMTIRPVKFDELPPTEGISSYFSENDYSTYSCAEKLLKKHPSLRDSLSHLDPDEEFQTEVHSHCDEYDFSREIMVLYSGLVKISNYYRKKYGIHIFIIENEAEIDTILKENPGLQNFGIIYAKRVHVVPFLINKTADSFQVIDLDSTGAESSFSDKKKINDKFESFEAQIIQCIPRRQADGYSCRTDALVLLKNSLLNLQQRPIRDFRDIMEIKVKDFFATVKKLPLSWCHTFQICERTKGIESKAILRPRRVGKKPESVYDFAKRHRDDYDMFYRYKIQDSVVGVVKRENRHTFLVDKSLKYYHLLQRLNKEDS
jgi:hypothetical protein